MRSRCDLDYVERPQSTLDTQVSTGNLVSDDLALPNKSRLPKKSGACLKSPFDADNTLGKIAL